MLDNCVSVNSLFESSFESWILLAPICPNTGRLIRAGTNVVISDQEQTLEKQLARFRRSQRNHEIATTAPAMATNAAAHTTAALSMKAATSAQLFRWGRFWMCGVMCIFRRKPAPQFWYDRLHRRWVIGATIERNRIRTATPAEVVAGLFDRAVPRGSGSAVPVLLLRGPWNRIAELNRWATVQRREAERVELARKFEEAKNAPQRQLIAAGRPRRCTGAGGFFGSHSPFAP
jgi:hypothetical protein